jgi:hypothetical protein
MAKCQRTFEGGEDRLHCDRHVGRLAGRLEVDPHRAEATRGVEVILEPHRARGLAGLSPGVEREVAMPFDELQHGAQPPFGREHVVLARDAGAGGVEEREHAERGGRVGEVRLALRCVGSPRARGAAGATR